MEVVQPDDRQRLHTGRATQHLEQHPALRVLGFGDAHEIGDRWGNVDAADFEPTLGDVVAAGQERRAHVDVVGEVLHVRHVPVLAEELRLGDQRSWRRSVELVRRV
jgi:hypothetical protein